MPKPIEYRTQLKHYVLTLKEKHEQFKEMLDNFDWYWSESHDNKRRQKGFEQQQKLRTLYKQDKDFKRLYNKYYKQIFNLRESRSIHVQL